MPDTLILARDKTLSRTKDKGLVPVHKWTRLTTQGGFKVCFHFCVHKPHQQQRKDKDTCVSEYNFSSSQGSKQGFKDNVALRKGYRF